MTQPGVFPLSSGTGFAAAAHGNILILTTRSGRFDATVQAFTTDANTQYQTFDTPDEAIQWATQTAASHQGHPNRYATIEYWEVREGHSITISRTPEGLHKPYRHPIWVDSDHVPVMGLRETFPTQEQALDWIRTIVDEEMQQERDYQRRIQEIQAALAINLS